MRGKARAGKGEGQNDRITPAYAGKSLKLIVGVVGTQDHPRVCGEKERSSLMKLQRMGSPPRMRGKVIIHLQYESNLRITPAYAGKRSTSVRSGWTCWDHPRVCGEKASPTRSPKTNTGSPPRMRGKGAQVDLIFTSTRITPAYAGKSTSPPLITVCKRDHPRVCGEKTNTWLLNSDTPGSPPRMRGKGATPRLGLGHVGITPAYAGKSVWYNRGVESN